MQAMMWDTNFVIPGLCYGSFINKKLTLTTDKSTFEVKIRDILVLPNKVKFKTIDYVDGGSCSNYINIVLLQVNYPIPGYMLNNYSCSQAENYDDIVTLPDLIFIEEDKKIYEQFTKFLIDVFNNNR